MGWLGSVWSSVCSVVSSACSSVCSVVNSVCSTLGSLGSSIGGAVEKFVSVLDVALPRLGTVLYTISLVASIVSEIAEFLGLKEQNKDKPEELALKAEISDLKPENFDSIEAYIKHLQEKIDLSDEDRSKLGDREKRAAYQATGTYLYAKGIGEKLGLETEGWKNPELTGVTADILADLAILNKVIRPAEFVAYCRHLHSAGLTMDDFSNYLHGRSKDIMLDKKVQNAIAGSMMELDPSLTESDIDRKLYELNIKDKN